MMNLKRSYLVTHLKNLNRYKSSTVIVKSRLNLTANAYKPEIVEKDKYDSWETQRLFEPDLRSRKPRFTMVLPPPNITGKLHLGHALSCTIQDVIARRKRSLGYSVLWLPGTDHAGIATQGVVEKYLSSTKGLDRLTLGREKFNNEVWKWKEKHGNTITRQLRRLGCSLDWSKEVFTMSPKHTHAVNTAFIKLFEKGYIYRKKALVNWCNALKSTVSDIEVESLPINGPTDIMLPGYKTPVKFGQLYTFAYKILFSDEEIFVSTTLPETMLGDTAIAVNPDDERYKHLKGALAIHPFREEAIPIIHDNMVDMKFATGAVKITPAHSKIDYVIGKHHNLPLLTIFDEDGKIINANKFNGYNKYECRDKIVEELNKMGLMKSVEPHSMTLPICSRTGDVIEYLPKEQWFLSCSELNKVANQVVKEDKLKIEPEKFIKNWLDWTNDDRDWCISRQLWWGHQIPAYKCSVGKDLIWTAAVDEKTAKIQASKFLRTLPDEITAEKDTDVLDTWFSSGIYPFASLGWPDNTEELKTFYPLDLMVTGHDILGFWVHRMVILALKMTDKLPFDNVLLHGVICDNKGAKMSKTRGNVIDPIDVIDGITLEKLKDKAVNMHKEGILNKDELNKAKSYHKSNFSNTNGIPQCGVDALRFTLLSQDVGSHFVSFDVNQCHANKLFCNKIWQSVKYTQLSFDKLKPTIDRITIDNLTLFDKWILSRLAEMVEAVEIAMDAYQFHVAVKSLRSMIYNEFCDVYLEATKPGFEEDNFKIGYAHAHSLSAVLNTSLRCLAPLMIYITEELIPKIPNFETNIIHNFKDTENLEFPKCEDFRIWRDKYLETQVYKILNTIFLIRELKGLYNVSNKLKPAVYITSKDNELIQNIKSNSKIALNLSRSSIIKFEEVNNKNTINANLDKYTSVSIVLQGDDVENILTAAKSRINKRVKKIEESIQKLTEKITSDRYLNTIPENDQLLDKAKLLEKQEELKRLQRLI